MSGTFIIVSAQGGERIFKRRHGILGAAGALATAGAVGIAQGNQAGSDAEDWNVFRNRFLAPDGRVVDTGNRNVSHSEGQGYGLYAAVRADDRQAFQRILTWTLTSLKRPNDNLFAWRFAPDGTPPVTDLNNASDGDLMIAWALVEAGRKWRHPDYIQRGLAIARDLQRLCFLNLGRRWLLLPGAYGFRAANRVVVNLSYYVLPALQELGRELRDATWTRVEMDALALLEEARFGQWQLPPDWLEIQADNGALRIARNWPPRFSFDAVRIPLNLCWGGSGAHAVVRACADFWTHRGPGAPMPAWTELPSNVLAPYPANPGIRAVALLSKALRDGAGARAVLPRVAQAQGEYYSAALVMLARMAWRDLLRV